MWLSGLEERFTDLEGLVVRRWTFCDWVGQSLFANIDRFLIFFKIILFLHLSPIKYIFLRRLACRLKKVGKNVLLFWGIDSNLRSWLTQTNPKALVMN